MIAVAINEVITDVEAQVAEVPAIAEHRHKAKSIFTMPNFVEFLLSTPQHEFHQRKRNDCALVHFAQFHGMKDPWIDFDRLAGTATISYGTNTDNWEMLDLPTWTCEFQKQAYDLSKAPAFTTVDPINVKDLLDIMYSLQNQEKSA